jgi:hypothetical protein
MSRARRGIVSARAEIEYLSRSGGVRRVPPDGGSPQALLATLAAVTGSDRRPVAFLAEGAPIADLAPGHRQWVYSGALTFCA